MEQTPRAFFQTTFNPIGRACAARHARAGLGLQGKWRTRACLAAHTLPCVLRLADCSRFCGCKRFEKQLRFSAVDCRSSEKQKAACTTCFLAEPLTRTATPSSLPWERVRERAASRKACIGAVRCSERLPKFGECPLPNPPPQGREQIAADSSVAGRLKKNARNINSRDFQVAFIARQMEQTPRAFFQTAFEPSVGCVPQGTHAVDWGCGKNGERVRTAHALHAGYGLINYGDIYGRYILLF